MEFSEGRKDTPGRYKRDCDLSIIEWSILKKRKVSSWESIVHILLLRMGGKKKIRSWEGDSPMRQSSLLLTKT